MIKKNQVCIAHCPESNTNLSSGVAPVRKYLELGIKDRLERMIYLADDRNVIAKFVNGNGFLRNKDGIKRTFFGGAQ